MANFLKGSEDMFKRWNPTTVNCFLHNMICSGCPENEVCAMNPKNNNLYKMRAVKFAALMTYKNLGKPKGEE